MSKSWTQRGDFLIGNSAFRKLKLTLISHISGQDYDISAPYRDGYIIARDFGELTHFTTNLDDILELLKESTKGIITIFVLTIGVNRKAYKATRRIKSDYAISKKIIRIINR